MMRDPRRIHEIVKLLEEAWEFYPDWRLGQLISNATYFEADGSRKDGTPQLFNAEDGRFRAGLTGLIHNAKKEAGS